MKSISEAKRLFTEYVKNNEPEISSDWTDLDGAELFFMENGEPFFDVDCILNDDEEGVSFYLNAHFCVCREDEARLEEFMQTFVKCVLGVKNGRPVHTDFIDDNGSTYIARKCIYFSLEDAE